MHIALFITCFNDTLFPQTGRAVVTLLERLGHQVVFPPEQTCCGQMHYNTGYHLETIPLMQRFVNVFRDYETIVSPSASCVGVVRDIYPRLAAMHGDATLAAEIEALVPRVFELSELLVNHLGIEDVGAYYPHHVAYHPTCHSSRVLHLGDAPLRLLKAVTGLTLVDLPAAEECCGFGGTFAVKNADVSTAMLADKVRALLQTGCEVCTAVDNSCLMHIGGALHRQRAATSTVHIAEILASTVKEYRP